VAYFDGTARDGEARAADALPEEVDGSAATGADAAGQASRRQAPGRGNEADIAFERRTIACLPMDLERVARAESVDGWSLVDTTIDEDRPGGIIAHFRRPARASAADMPAGGAAAAGEQATATPSGSPGSAGTSRRSAASGRDAEAAREPAPSADPKPIPAPKASSARPDYRYLLYVVFVVVGMLVLLRVFGWLGFFIALFVLPGVVRGLLGIPNHKKKRRSRRRKRRRRS
jgi:hypothetical protein